MKSTSIIALATLASASGIERRDTATIMNDLSTIISEVNILTAAFNNFTDLDVNGSPLIVARDNLNTTLVKSLGDIEASAPIADADANSVANAIKNLIPAIFESLNAGTSKHAVILSNAIAGPTNDSLMTIRGDTSRLNAALISKLPSAVLPAVSAASSCIDQAFNSAVANPPVSVNTACANGLTVAGGAGATSSAPQTASATATPTSQSVASSPSSSTASSSSSSSSSAISSSSSSSSSSATSQTTASSSSSSSSAVALTSTTTSTTAPGSTGGATSLVSKGINAIAAAVVVLVL